MKRLAAFMVLPAMACATSGPSGRATGPSGCDGAAAQGVVGRLASPQAAAEAQTLSGADLVRWLRPGQMITMEYREGRLNLRLDSNNRIEAVTCG